MNDNLNLTRKAAGSSNTDSEIDLSRRTFLISSAFISFSLISGIMPELSLAAPANRETAKLVLSCFWDYDLDAVLDYKEDIEFIFGKPIEDKLRIVKNKDNYGLVCDLELDEKTMALAAAEYNAVLEEHDCERASVIEDSEYELLHNVSYCLGPHFKAIRKIYNEVYAILGDKIGKEFVVEKTHSDNFALVYKTLKQGRAARKIMKEHNAILKKSNTKIRASTIIDKNHEIVYEESDFLEEKTNGTAPKITVSCKKKKPVKNRASIKLERKIEEHIKKLRKKGQISSDEHTAWSVYDFTLGEKLVSINENIPYQSASMIKPFVALAFFTKLKENSKKYSYTRRRRRRMEAMIRRSSNPSTNYFINMVSRSPSGVEKYLKRKYPHIFQNTMIVEQIPADGRTYRNKASARDYSRFLYALWNDQLPYSKEIKRLMRLPNRDRICRGAKKIPPGTMVYDKTGTTARLCGNMGIVVARGKNGKKYPYTLVGIIDKDDRAKNYYKWKTSRSRVIREVSDIVYTELKKTHNLV
ncbi:MAG: serine hydrolase [Desulfobacterales bacterium]|nr:serine hydrolase [Desulfobacterales bacterium]